jgi:hypothetical protein
VTGIGISRPHRIAAGPLDANGSPIALIIHYDRGVVRPNDEDHNRLLQLVRRMDGVASITPDDQRAAYTVIFEEDERSWHSHATLRMIKRLLNPVQPLTTTIVTEADTTTDHGWVIIRIHDELDGDEQRDLFALLRSLDQVDELIRATWRDRYVLGLKCRKSELDNVLWLHAALQEFGASVVEPDEELLKYARSLAAFGIH